VKLLKYMRTALESLALHKTRAVLTMLGIIIGVTAVVTTVGIGRGAAANITQRIQSQGTNLLTITPGSTNTGGLSNGGGTARTLTVADAEALLDPSLQPRPEIVVPDYSSNARIVYADTNTQNSVVGTTPDYIAVHSYTMADGRFLSADDSKQSNQVAVLGANLATELFGASEPVGQSIRINGNPFKVVGVLQTTGGTGFNRTDTQVFVPLGVAQSLLFNAPRYRGQYTVTDMTVKVANIDQMTAVQDQVEITLRLRHDLKAGEVDDFNIFNQASLLQVADQVAQTLTLLLGAVGAISLLVGGIGIMNIMLVSVTERTREIGLRKAIGAHDGDILLQFLAEALSLCALGGLVGVGLAYGVAFAIGHIPSDY
jgi:putative ABC transport system permease protein